jgi:hypothetical protein
MWDPTYATSNGYEYSYSKLMTSALMLLIPGPYPNIRLYREILQVPPRLLNTTEQLLTGFSLDNSCQQPTCPLESLNGDGPRAHSLIFPTSPLL